MKCRSCLVEGDCVEDITLKMVDGSIRQLSGVKSELESGCLFIGYPEKEGYVECYPLNNIYAINCLTKGE